MPQCQYITEKGMCCTRTAISGSKYCYQHLKIVKEQMPTYFSIMPSDIIKSLFLYFNRNELLDIISKIIGKINIIPQYNALKSNDFWKIFWKRDISSLIPPPENIYNEYKDVVEYSSYKRKFSVYDHYFNVVKYLIVKNYDVLLYKILSTLHSSILKDFYDFSLYVAAGQGRHEIVERMLGLGASEYNFAMQMAARGGHIEIVKRLLDKGATDYNSALQEASTEGHIDIVKLMLDKGASNFNEALKLAKTREIADLIDLYANR